MVMVMMLLMMVVMAIVNMISTNTSTGKARVAHVTRDVFPLGTVTHAHVRTEQAEQLLRKPATDQNE